MPHQQKLVMRLVFAVSSIPPLGTSGFKTVINTMHKCKGKWPSESDHGVILSIYNEKGLNVQHIPYDHDFWLNKLLPKLVSFYDNCVAPEIVSPLHPLGIPLRNLSEK